MEHRRRHDSVPLSGELRVLILSRVPQPLSLRGALRGHVPSYTLGCFCVASNDVALSRLSNQLVNTALRKPRRYCHVVTTQRVAEIPGLHQPISHRVTVGDLILGCAKLVHVLALNM
jgi:hypothetical protein